MVIHGKKIKYSSVNFFRIFWANLRLGKKVEKLAFEVRKRILGLKILKTIIEVYYFIICDHAFFHDFWT